MKKQFNLDYYLAHPDTKVVTRDGRDVRILCTDLDDKDYPIAASCINLSGDGTDIDTYAADGKVLLGSRSEHYRDLFFNLPDPEKKKVPLTYEDLLERVRTGKTMWVQDKNNCSLISYFNKSGDVCFGDISYSTERLMNNAERFVDGTPCWKEVEV